MPAFLRFRRFWVLASSEQFLPSPRFCGAHVERAEMTAACALILAATLSTIGEHPGRSIAAQTSPGPIAAAIATAPALDVAVETWMLDRKVGRPAAVKIMYGSLAALQA